MLSRILNIKVLFWLVLFLTLFIRGIIFLDPDFGWRLRSGELILQSGIPETDPFTYSMPSYPWINHAWLTDVIIAFIYPIFGYPGLSLLFSLIAITAIYITYSLIQKIKLNNKVNAWYLGLPLLLLTSSSFFRFSGIRAQVWTWLFMAIIFKFVFDNYVWKKWKYALPFIFLFWVNLHGGFAAGLAVVAFAVLVGSFREKKLIVADWVLLLLSFAATFVNPYGLQIYKEVLFTLSDSENHKYILEWNNYFKSFNLPSLFLLAFSSILIFGSYRKLKFIEASLFTLFLYQALTAVRQVPLWAMTAFYTSFRVLADFIINLKEKVAFSRFKEIYRIFYILAILVFAAEILMTTIAAVYYSEKAFYPKNAVSYLKENPPRGEIFAKYDYGGYLIWQMPEKKVFIDGRMPFWKRKEAVNGESGNAMKEYMSVFKGETHYRDLFDRYNVEVVLWSNPDKGENISQFEQKYSNVFNFLYKLLSVEKQNFSLINDLEKDGWKVVYEDGVAVIYEKP